LSKQQFSMKISKEFQECFTSTMYRSFQVLSNLQVQ